MGLLADFFVAAPVDAPSYEQHQGRLPAGRFEVWQSGDFTSLELEQLWAILAGEKWSHKLHRLERLPAAGESWLFRFPDPFLGRLASLDAAALPQVAAQWAAIEKLSCPPADLMPVLESLTALARAAHGTSRGLFLWGSL
jgi:hypothetical protein